MFPLTSKVKIPSPGFNIDYKNKILLLGSCFADNIGMKLERLKFQSLHNPFGVIYNPYSLANNLQVLLDKKRFIPSDLNFFNELWFSFNHHSAFSSVNRKECLNRINDKLAIADNMLMKADFLFLTFGTAWVYRYKKSGEVVNNCHKIPAKEFDRFFMTSAEITNLIGKVIDKLLYSNPGLKIIVTVSPIRHLKDGAIENQRSKSSLLLAVKELEEQFQQLYYFPSYEVFMDELRDYRFYDSDLVHPSLMGIDYLWNKFADTFMDSDTVFLMNQIEKLVKGLDHKPINKDTKSYSNFVKGLIKLCENIAAKNKHVDISKEVAFLQSQNV